MTFVQGPSAAQEPLGGVAVTPWWLVLLEGIAGLILGLLLLTNTARTIFTLVLILGIFWFVTGLVDLVMMFVDRRQWGWKLFSGVIGIIAGLVVIRQPIWAAALLPATLVWLLGVAGVVIGTVGIVRALTGGGWGIGLLGALSIVIGILLLLHTALSTLALIYAVAVIAVLGGILAIIGSFFLLGAQRRRGGAGDPVSATAPYRP